jgi:dCTP deaminase
MYLSDRDLLKAIKSRQLIVEPNPTPDRIGASSIDLQLDSLEEARIWDIARFHEDRSVMGDKPRELRIGKFDYRKVSSRYLIAPPNEDSQKEQLVFRRDSEVVIKPGGFLLWQTREKVGTPARNSRFICFIDGKSTRARTGLLVHLTAPTIHANWSGRVTLEIANLGPFDFVLSPGDVIAQIIVARISSRPLQGEEVFKSTLGQRTVLGRPTDLPPPVSKAKDRRKRK